jgi:hypothetical protein
MPSHPSMGLCTSHSQPHATKALIPPFPTSSQTFWHVQTPAPSSCSLCFSSKVQERTNSSLIFQPLPLSLLPVQSTCKHRHRHNFQHHQPPLRTTIPHQPSNNRDIKLKLSLTDPSCLLISSQDKPLSNPTTGGRNPHLHKHAHAPALK